MFYKTFTEAQSYRSAQQKLLFINRYGVIDEYRDNFVIQPGEKIYSLVPNRGQVITFRSVYDWKELKGVAPEDRCPCGSGKKLKNCCIDRLTYEDLEADFGTKIDTTLISIQVDEETKRVKFLNKFTQTEIYPQYAHLIGATKQRKADKKTPIFKVPLEPQFLTNNLAIALSRFHGVFGIDTNEHKSRKGLYGGMPMRLCLEELNKQSERVQIPLQIFGDKFFVVREKKYENANWAILVQEIRKHPNYSDNLRIGIVVDSDFGNLHSYNCAKLPFFGKELLPSNFKLIYATADKPNESIVNQFIAKCDYMSNHMLSQMNEPDAQKMFGDWRQTYN